MSFFNTIVHEGFYPFRNKNFWSREEKELPKCFSPTFEDVLTPEEFKKFGFTEEEEKEILSEYFPKGEEKGDKHTVSADELDSKHSGGGVLSKEHGPRERPHSVDDEPNRSTGEGKEQEDGENDIEITVVVSPLTEKEIPSPLPSLPLPPFSRE